LEQADFQGIKIIASVRFRNEFERGAFGFGKAAPRWMRPGGPSGLAFCVMTATAGKRLFTINPGLAPGTFRRLFGLKPNPPKRTPDGF
jgi:hypothetical protein